MSDGRELTAKALVIATGAEYRRLDLPNLERFVGRSIFYTTFGEPQFMSLEKEMSAYLVQQIRRKPNVDVRLGCEVVDGQGEALLFTIANPAQSKASRRD